MKLNPDCIRDTLLQIEKDQQYTKGVIGSSLNRLSGALLLETDLKNKYSTEDIMYTVKQLHDHFYIDAGEFNAIGTTDYIIRDIAPIGHAFLANIRNDTNWNKTKNVLQKVGTFALDYIKDVSAQVAAESISAIIKGN